MQQLNVMISRYLNLLACNDLIDFADHSKTVQFNRTDMENGSRTVKLENIERKKGPLQEFCKKYFVPLKAWR